MSDNVQTTSSGNTFLPPGAPDPNAPEDVAVHIGQEQPQESAEYPAVGVTDEVAHHAQVEAEAEARVARAKAVSAPRRLSDREKQLISILLDLDVVKQAESITDVEVPLEALPENVRLSFFEAGNDRNVFQRGLATPVYGGEPKTLVGLKLREVTMDLYSRLTRVKADGVKQKATKVSGEPRAVGGRAATKYDGLRLRKMADNPRAEGTMGYYSWQLYQDGMTYKEYMASKTFPTSLSKRTEATFRGPGRNHWEWDLQHGYIALYRDGEEELLEDGSPNPNYWAINNNPR